jgi:uncharacterized protein (TIGR00730 family)
MPEGLLTNPSGPIRNNVEVKNLGFFVSILFRTLMAEMNLDTTQEVLYQVEQICTPTEGDLRSWLHKEVLLNALKFKRDELETLDLKVMNRAMAEFRYAARVFRPYRLIRKVSIFGSARTPTTDPYYQAAEEFAQMSVRKGFMVITGAAEGIMKAGNVGAGAEKSFGANILLPFEQGANVVISEDPKLITFRYFFIRKLFFMMEADAVALFPGGFGTHDEGFETLTLLQTGKAQPMPLVLIELPGEDYWESWEGFVKKQLLNRGLISDQDLALYRIVHSPEEAVEWICDFYSTYHSTRRVGDKLLVRLEKALLPDQIKELNRSFADIIAKGEVEPTEVLAAEADEPHLHDKPRITFSYNEQSASRLTQMIHTINRMGRSQMGHSAPPRL